MNGPERLYRRKSFLLRCKIRSQRPKGNKVLPKSNRGNCRRESNAVAISEKMILSSPIKHPKLWFLGNFFHRLCMPLQALEWLRGGSDVSPELEALLASSGGGEPHQQPTSILSTLAEFRKPGAYRPFGLLIAIFVLQQLTGSYAVIFYAVNIFQVLYRPFSLLKPNISIMLYLQDLQKDKSGSPYVPAIMTGEDDGDGCNSNQCFVFAQKGLKLKQTVFVTTIVAAVANPDVLWVSFVSSGLFWERSY